MVRSIVTFWSLNIFLKDKNGKRPGYGDTEMFQNDDHWQDLILFYEYFHANQRKINKNQKIIIDYRSVLGPIPLLVPVVHN